MSSLRRITLSGALVLAPFVVAAHAHADDAPSAALRWTDSSPACVDAASLRGSVERVLGREVFVEGDTIGALRVEGVLRRESRGFVAEVTLTRANGEALGTRTIRQAGRRCDLLAGSLGVVLALMLDGAASTIELPPPPPEPPGTSAPPPPPSPSPSSAPPAAPRPPPSEGELRARLDAHLGASVWAGLLPGAAWSFESRTRVRMEPSAFSLSVGLSLLPSVDARLADTEAGGRFQALLAHVAVCASALARPSLELLGCAGAAGGLARGVGQGVDLANEASRALGGPLLELAALVRPWSPLEVALRGGVFVPANRPTFYVSAGSEALNIHETSAISGFFGITLGLRTGSENSRGDDL